MLLDKRRWANERILNKPVCSDVVEWLVPYTAVVSQGYVRICEHTSRYPWDPLFIAPHPIERCTCRYFEQPLYIQHVQTITVWSPPWHTLPPNQPVWRGRTG